MRQVVISLALLAAAPPVLAQDAVASVVIARGTPAAIADALAAALAPQKFRLASSSKSRVVLSLQRGAAAQTGGEIVRIRLDVGFRLQETPQGIRASVSDETLVADQNGFEQRRPQDLGRNRQSYQNLLDRIRAELDGAAAPAESTPR